MSGNSLPRAALKVPLSLGIGRHVCQLKRLTLKFCKFRSDNGGLRDFIEKEVTDFARVNLSTVVYIKPRRNRPPLLVAEYLNGNFQYLRAAKMTCEEISAWIENFRNRSGEHIMPIYKMRNTANPSVQGIWNPYLVESDSAQSIMTPSEIVSNLASLSACSVEWEQPAQDLLIEFDKHRRLHSSPSSSVL